MAAPVFDWPAGAGLFGAPIQGYGSKVIDRSLSPVTCPGCGLTWTTETVRSWWLSHTRCLACMHTSDHRLPTEAECARWRIATARAVADGLLDVLAEQFELLLGGQPVTVIGATMPEDVSAGNHTRVVRGVYSAP